MGEVYSRLPGNSLGSANNTVVNGADGSVIKRRMFDGNGVVGNAFGSAVNAVQSWGRSNQPELAGQDSAMFDFSGPVNAIKAWDARQRSGSTGSEMPVLGQPVNNKLQQVPVSTVAAPSVVSKIADRPDTNMTSAQILGATPLPKGFGQRDTSAPSTTPEQDDASRLAARTALEEMYAKQAAAQDTRLAETALVNEQRANSAKLGELRERADKLATPIGMTGRDEFNMSFVGEAKASNPSYKNAMMAQKAFLSQQSGHAAELANVNTQIQSLTGQRHNDQTYETTKLGQGITERNGQRSDETTRRGQDMTLDAHKYTADQNMLGKIESAKETAQGRQAAAAAKVAEDENKQIHDILTNGYQVAPTPEAIKAYKTHQTKLTAWGSGIDKALQAEEKANPDRAQFISKALLDYHRNPNDEAAKSSIAAARSLLTGGGKGVEPDWFKKAVSKPVFDKVGMQPWKQPEQPLLGAQ